MLRKKYEIPIVKRIGAFEKPKQESGPASYVLPVLPFAYTPNTSNRRGTLRLASCRLAVTNTPSSCLLCARNAGCSPKALYGGRARSKQNWAMRYPKQAVEKHRKELGSARLLRSEKGQYRSTLSQHTSSALERICYARYADCLLLGFVGPVELAIQKRIAHFQQSGLNLVGSEGRNTIAARSTVEFPGTVIRKVPTRTPIPFVRELEKRLRVKHRILQTAFHLRSAIQFL